MSHVMVFGTRSATVEEVERERMHEAACDYVEQDHVLAEQEEAV